MNEEEIIEDLKKTIEYAQKCCREDTYINQETLFAVLNLLEKKDAEITKLKNNNKELLRKLRNRVKEVKKLTKYSLYKTEFSNLNKQLEKKDKIINLMAEQLTTPVHSKEWVIEFYKKKVEKENE